MGICQIFKSYQAIEKEMPTKSVCPSQSDILIDMILYDVFCLTFCLWCNIYIIIIISS